MYGTEGVPFRTEGNLNRAAGFRLSLISRPGSIMVRQRRLPMGKVPKLVGTGFLAVLLVSAAFLTG